LFIVSRISDRFLKPKVEALKTGGLRTARVAVLVLLIAAAGWWFVKFLTINQSVLIYRVFDTNVRICLSHISQSEERQLRARFAAVRTRADYLAIDKELRAIAVSAGVRLVDIRLW
jgi:hypothetical protein